MRALKEARLLFSFLLPSNEGKEAVRRDVKQTPAKRERSLFLTLFLLRHPLLFPPLSAPLAQLFPPFPLPSSSHTMRAIRYATVGAPLEVRKRPGRGQKQRERKVECLRKFFQSINKKRHSPARPRPPLFSLSLLPQKNKIARHRRPKARPQAHRSPRPRRRRLDQPH